MDRRQWISTLGAATAGVAMATRAEAQDEVKEKDHDLHENCANACYDCARKCSQAFQYCHKRVVDGMKGYAKSTGLCNDCADVCLTTAKLVDRRSGLMTIGCHACAQSCDECIAECEKMNDKELNPMLDAMRKCARLCHDMSKEMGHHKKHHKDGL